MLKCLYINALQIMRPAELYFSNLTEEDIKQNEDLSYFKQMAINY